MSGFDIPHRLWEAHTAEGRAIAAAAERLRDMLVDCVDAGGVPLRALARHVGQYLGTRDVNSNAGRTVRRVLGPSFVVAGTARFPRENGVESGATYRRR